MTPSPGRPAGRLLVRSALIAAAEVGPYFRLELLEQGLCPGWQLAHQFFLTGLPEVARSTAERLGTGETRVAFSILHLGFAARLWSPVLGCALLAGIVPDLTALVVSPEPSIRLGLTGLTGWNAGSPGEQVDSAGSSASSYAKLAELTAGAVAGPLAEFVTALPVRLPAEMLRGNSASALVGALGELVRAQPNLRESASVLASALLRTPSLAGAGRLSGPGLAFRRRSCCLYYRVPGGGLCGDCCLDRERRFALRVQPREQGGGDGQPG